MSEDQGSLGSVAEGAGIAVGLTIMGVVLGIVLIRDLVGLAMLSAIGIVQLLWMFPAWLIYQRKGRAETAKGILTTAGVIFLLNATCWGLVFIMR